MGDYTKDDARVARIASSISGESQVDRLSTYVHVSTAKLLSMHGRLLILGLGLTLVVGDRYSNPNVGTPGPELLARYPNFLELISNTYELYWNYTEGTSRLDIAVRVKTTGWVGLGVSEKGSMVNSDLAIGWVTDEGEPQIQVRFSLDKLYGGMKNTGEIRDRTFTSAIIVLSSHTCYS